MPKIHAHLFRYSSATIFAAIKGMTDQALKYRYGWTPSSDMSDKYIHLSGAESDDYIRQAFGRPVVQKKVAGKVMITCPRCRMDNYADADRCYNCQQALSESEIAKEKALEEAREAAREAAIIEGLQKKLVEAFILKRQKIEKWLNYQSMEDFFEPDEPTSGTAINTLETLLEHNHLVTKGECEIDWIGEDTEIIERALKSYRKANSKKS